MPRYQNYKLIILNQIQSQSQFKLFRMKVETSQSQCQKKSFVCGQRMFDEFLY